jgi:hypothetical protein
MAEQQTSGATGQTQHTHNRGCLFCGVAMPLFERCWSEATRDHFRNSRIEFLKGIRGLIDDRIAHLSRQEHKGTHVTVE